MLCLGDRVHHRDIGSGEQVLSLEHTELEQERLWDRPMRAIVIIASFAVGLAAIAVAPEGVHGTWPQRAILVACHFLFILGFTCGCLGGTWWLRRRTALGIGLLAACAVWAITAVAMVETRHDAAFSELFSAAYGVSFVIWILLVGKCRASVRGNTEVVKPSNEPRERTGD